MQGIAAWLDRDEPTFVEAAEPGPPPAGQVLCRTLQLGICGTDREILASRRPWTPPESDYLILGHECLAEVVELAPGSLGVSPGDLVVPIVRRPIGVPRHRVDLLTLGEFTERGIIREHGFSSSLWHDRPRNLFPVSRDLREVAVLTEPVAVAEKGIHEAHLIQQARIAPDVWTSAPPRVLVTGLGPIAFAALLGSLNRGWPTTIAGRDSPDTFRASLADTLGAGYAPLNSGALEPADAEADGFDLILECTGSDEIMVRASHALASRGAIVWLGSSRRPQPVSLNVAKMMRDGVIKNHVHIGSVNAAPRDFLSALSHLAAWRAKDPQSLAAIITIKVAPAESLWHYTHRTPQGIKTVLIYD